MSTHVCCWKTASGNEFGRLSAPAEVSLPAGTEEITEEEYQSLLDDFLARVLP